VVVPTVVVLESTAVVLFPLSEVVSVEATVVVVDSVVDVVVVEDNVVVEVVVVDSVVDKVVEFSFASTFSRVAFTAFNTT